MELARVLGTVVAERKSPGLEGVKLLLAQPVDTTMLPVGEPFVVADRFSAGPGQVVWWVGGREAALALPETFVPVDAAVVAIAEEIFAEGIYATDLADGPRKARTKPGGDRP